MTKAQTHQVLVGQNDLWETPQERVIDFIHTHDLDVELDVCATPQNTKFSNYFTLKDNALEQEWDRSFFMNPPYSEITQWMQKAYEEHKKYNVTGVCLVFAKTSTKWWHQYVEGKADVYFQKGRIRFLLNGIEPRYCKNCKKRSTDDNPYCELCGENMPKSSPTYDSVWVVYRRKEEC